ncbi:glycine zipper domain-containing protein [Bosea sp. (in: a-proteobacteria)]|uniref:glycine zipper domain-containing protein n=1 Tax=Bosea sp. (in: a-proteobacteria) TaxID=1871050 RepID=UPI002FC92607
MAATSTPAKRQAAASVKRAKDDVAEGAAEVAGRAKATGRRLRGEASEIEDSLARGAEDLAATVSNRLRAVGVDTDKMVDVAKEQAGDLQDLIVREIQERPLRALGLAAAVGLFVGFLSAR